MALSFSKRAMIGSLVTCLVLVVTYASSDNSILTVPLFEVGSLWIRATQSLMSRTASMVHTLDTTNPLTYVALTLVAYISWKLYQVFFVPYNRVCLMGDLGYIPEGKMSMKDKANQVHGNRRIGECPPVYPNGWFMVLESRDLDIEESKSIGILGLQLAVFRASDGTAHVLDAYCPHLGADLGVGGQVKGNCIECPFHGWRFRGDDGKCVDIPYCRDKKIPDVARVKAYTTVERNGFVYMWYHAEGSEPYWEPPEIENISNGTWRYRGRTEHIISCHIEDIPENGADVAHLPQVHGPSLTTGIDLRYLYSGTLSKIWSFAKHNWDGYWTASTEEGEKHIGTLDLMQTLSVFGMHLPIVDVHVKARQTGPGIVNMHFTSPIGNGVYIHNVTPIEPLKQRLVQQIYFTRFAPPFIAKFFMAAEALMIERDIMIWNHKRYANKPIYVKADSDSLLARHRRWYSQFYSENSPRMHFKKDTLEW